MRPQDQLNRRSTQGFKCESLCNDNQGERSTKLIARQTTKS